MKTEIAKREAPEKEYLLQVKIKNNKLLCAARRKGINNMAELSRATGISQGQLGRLLNLKTSAVDIKGGIRPCVLKLCESLGVTPVELFPVDNFVEPLSKNKAEIEADLEDIKQLDSRLRSSNPFMALVKEDAVKTVNRIVSAVLTPREKNLLSIRYGLAGEKDLSIEDAAKQMGLQKENARQIEKKALRKLGVSCSARRATLRQALNDIDSFSTCSETQFNV